MKYFRDPDLLPECGGPVIYTSFRPCILLTKLFKISCITFSQEGKQSLFQPTSSKTSNDNWKLKLPLLKLEGIWWVRVELRSFLTVVLNTGDWLACWSQWPRGLRPGSAAARLLRLWVRIPQGTWMFVCCEFCVLSGRGLCDELITRLEESYRLWCVVVWSRNLVNEEALAHAGLPRQKQTNWLA